MVKTRVTVTLDPRVIRRAKSVARARNTNLSALIEDLLEQAANGGSIRSSNFTQKWSGKFTVRESDVSDPLLDVLKAHYNLDKPAK